MAHRWLLRSFSVALALACLGLVAYLAFDWADYGSDSTCGSLVRYKGAGGTCAHIMRGRVFGVVAFGVAAIVLLGVAWRAGRRARDEARVRCHAPTKST